METPQSLEAGLFVRRQIRRYLMEEGVPFDEEKGLLDSLFILRPQTMQHQMAIRNLRTIADEWTEKRRARS